MNYMIPAVLALTTMTAAMLSAGNPSSTSSMNFAAPPVEVCENPAWYRPAYNSRTLWMHPIRKIRTKPRGKFKGKKCRYKH